ncbi:MAG: triose-phosphate isomerase [Candidatus Paceibacterota bacterium]|jgi:triosephosphate isomerase
MLKTNKKLIVGNWKMNPESVVEAKEISSEINKNTKHFKNTNLVVCPPFVFLNEVSKIFSKNKKISLGAQDIFVGNGVSHTGEVGSDMLKNLDVKYIIIGHSDRRESLDDESLVREKLFGTLKDGFKAILCVGEKERNEHGDQYNEVKSQIESAITKLPKKFIKNLIVAYEPIWAIGKAESDAVEPEDLHEMTIFIKRVISDILGIKEAEKIIILYGGSVTKNNAKEIIEKGNVAGLLVGRESLKPNNFIELIKSIE